MNIEDFRELCLSFPQSEENAPWADTKYQSLITFTVAGKWFCLTDMDEKRCNIKCRPEQVAELQDQYRGIELAWHMNKTHWIGLYLDSDVPEAKIRELIKEAYELIVRKLSKAKRAELGLS